MNKTEFLSELADIIADNIDCEDVMENISGNGTEDVTLVFEDGTVIKVTAEVTKEEALEDDV